MSAITIIFLLIGYFGYFTATWKNHLSNNHKLCGKAGFCSNIKKLNLLHATGIILMGLPLIFLDKPGAIFMSDVLIINEQKLTVLAFLVLLTALIGRKTAVSITQKVQGVNNSSDAKSLVIYLPIRILFLVIYELFFRGVLIAVCIYYLDIKWAILLNVALYTLLHFFSEKEELVFCPLFGLILCLLTLWFHNVLPAVILHTTLSIAHEGYILKTVNRNLKHYRS